MYGARYDMKLQLQTCDTRYFAEYTVNVGPFLERAAAPGACVAATPFQATTWIHSWYHLLAPARAVEPVLVTVRDSATGELAMMLPLVLRHIFGLSIIEFADLLVSDYAVPLLGPAVPVTIDRAGQAWDAVLRCIPKCDLVFLDKLPEALNGHPNPLAFIANRSAHTVGNVLSLPNSWDEFLASRPRSFRKELRKHNRALMELGGGVSQTVVKVSEAHALLTKIEEFHHRRIEALGKAYVLDKPSYSNFYHDLIDRGLSSGFVKMFVLHSNDGVIAAAFSLLHGSCCTTVRLAHVGGEWNKASPGIILASEIVKWAIENQMNTFDFGIGKYDYKQRLGCQLIPLFTYAAPMSIKGKLALLAYDSKTFLRKNRVLRRMIGLVRLGLLRGDYHFKRHTKLFDRLGE